MNGAMIQLDRLWCEGLVESLELVFWVPELVLTAIAMLIGSWLLLTWRAKRQSEQAASETGEPI